MTDRFNALTVVLERDIREDDIGPLIHAIMHLKGIQRVTPQVVDVASHVAEQRARSAIINKLQELIEQLR